MALVFGAAARQGCRGFARATSSSSTSTSASALCLATRSFPAFSTTSSKALNKLKQVDKASFSAAAASAAASSTKTGGGAKAQKVRSGGWRGNSTNSTLPNGDIVYDAVLIGGGVMSSTVAVMLQQLEPTWKILIVEQMAGPALESSNAWNNAGTGHAALCELNYTSVDSEGTMDCSKAVDIGEKFLSSRQFWAHLVEQGIVESNAFINTCPHMSFVWGEKNCAFLKKRYEILKKEPLFDDMEYTEDYDTIKKWSPLLVSTWYLL